jgi:hypothetical protein
MRGAEPPVLVAITACKHTNMHHHDRNMEKIGFVDSYTYGYYYCETYDTTILNMIELREMKHAQ